MPIYEYVCEKCGSHLEVMQKVSDAPLKRCPKCRGKLEKLLSRTSFQLKGGGWYATDYSSKSKPPAESKPDKGTEKTENASAPKSSTGATTPNE
jgi:putative FmdB family regulatory protein